MSFITHNDELWPIVTITASGQFSLKQHTESLKQWNKWFARKETFYVIRVFLDNEAIEHTEDIGKSTVNWLKNGATKKIRDMVGAMLLVLPKAQYDDSKTINKIFGVPDGMFPSVATAHSYLQNIPSYDEMGLVDKVSKEDLDSLIAKSLAKQVGTKKSKAKKSQMKKSQMKKSQMKKSQMKKSQWV